MKIIFHQYANIVHSKQSLVNRNNNPFRYQYTQLKHLLLCQKFTQYNVALMFEFRNKSQNSVNELFTIRVPKTVAGATEELEL